MSKKLPLRYKRDWRWSEPPKLESGFYKHRIELLKSVSERVNHFPGYGREDYFYEYEEDDTEYVPEYSGALGSRESISLKDVLALVKKHNLNPENVHFTASFAEDYLAVEVVHINKLDEAGQLEEYQEALSDWAKTKKNTEEYEKERIQNEI